jgi:transcriptional regulator with XRE-family HTH domain
VTNCRYNGTMPNVLMSPVMLPDSYALTNLRKLRESRGWTRPELAERSGVAPRTVRELEAEPIEPGVGTAHRLAVALGVDVAALWSVDYSSEVQRVQVRRGKARS